MSRSYLALGALPALCTFLVLTAHADARYFRGELADRLSVERGHWKTFIWHSASIDEVRRLGLQPEHVARAFAGECMLPDDPKRPVHGRLVELKDGRSFAYLDVNRDGSFGPDEGAPLEVLPPGSSASAEARLLLPLRGGAYQEMPILVALPSASFGGAPSPPGTRRVLIGADPFIAGYAQLPFGRVLMHFSYDLVHDSAQPPLNAASTQEAMDLNRDGAIDTTPGSPELGYTHGSAPVFRLKDYYLQTTRIDLETRTFTMKTVPSSDYHRISMAVGDKVPDFEYRNFSEKKRHLSNVKGKLRLLNFWTAWCNSCVADLPGLKATYDRYHDQGFEILGMNGDDDTEKAEDIVDKLDIHWPQAKLDREMIETRFQISSWPTNVLVDRHGKVVALLDGVGDLDATLQRLLQ